MCKAWVWGLEHLKLGFQHLGEEVRVLSSPSSDGEVKASGGDVIRFIHAHHPIRVGHPVPIPTGNDRLFGLLFPVVGIIHVVERKESGVINALPLNGIEPAPVQKLPRHHHVRIAEEGQLVAVQLGQPQVQRPSPRKLPPTLHDEELGGGPAPVPGDDGGDAIVVALLPVHHQDEPHRQPPPEHVALEGVKESRETLANVVQGDDDVDHLPVVGLLRHQHGDHLRGAGQVHPLPQHAARRLFEQREVHDALSPVPRGVPEEDVVHAPELVRRLLLGIDQVRRLGDELLDLVVHVVGDP